MRLWEKFKGDFVSNSKGNTSLAHFFWNCLQENNFFRKFQVYFLKKLFTWKPFFSEKMGYACINLFIKAWRVNRDLIYSKYTKKNYSKLYFSSQTSIVYYNLLPVFRVHFSWILCCNFVWIHCYNLSWILCYNRLLIVSTLCF